MLIKTNLKTHLVPSGYRRSRRRSHLPRRSPCTTSSSLIKYKIIDYHSASSSSSHLVRAPLDTSGTRKKKQAHDDNTKYRVVASARPLSTASCSALSHRARCSSLLADSLERAQPVCISLSGSLCVCMYIDESARSERGAHPAITHKMESGARIPARERPRGRGGKVGWV